MKSFIAVSGIGESIDTTSEDIIFIEDGCLKSDIGVKKYRIQPKFVKTAKDIRKHVDIVNQAKRELLPAIADKMNEIHGVQYKNEQWQQILFFWYNFYMETMYCKYKNFENINIEEVYAFALNHKSYIHPYYEYGYWIWALTREEYNYQLYSHILEYKNVEIRKYIDLKTNGAIRQIKHDTFKDIVHRIITTLSKNKNTIIVNPQIFRFSLSELFKLWIRSHGKIGYWFIDKHGGVLAAYDEKFRKSIQIQSKETDSDFLRFMKKYIFEDMPIVFLEGFRNINQVNPKDKCRNVISCEEFWYYTEVANFQSHVKAAGGKVHTIKIGGDCDIWDGNSETTFDYEVSDVLYTTGWKGKNCKCKTQKVTNPRYYNAMLTKMDNPKKKCDILYVGTSAFAYQLLLCNVYSLFSREYVECAINFLKQLSDKKGLKIKARPFMDTGWRFEERIKNSKINVEIDDMNRKFIETVQESRLCVADSFGTPWAEVLVLDIPLIVVVPEYMEFYTQQGITLTSKLQEVGIYHNSYDKAAEYIKNNIDDIEGWWNDTKRKQVVNEIRREYTWCSSNPKEEWENLFLSIASK